MKKVMILFLNLLLASVNAASIDNLKLSDFSTFLGMSKNTSCDYVLDMFGEPDKDIVTSTSFIFKYGNSEIVCDYNSFKLTAISFCFADATDLLGIDKLLEKPANIFGARKYQLVRQFGQYQEIETNLFYYKLPNSMGGLELELSNDKVAKVSVDWVNKKAEDRESAEKKARIYELYRVIHDTFDDEYGWYGPNEKIYTSDYTFNLTRIFSALSDDYCKIYMLGKVEVYFDSGERIRYEGYNIDAIDLKQTPVKVGSYNKVYQNTAGSTIVQTNNSWIRTNGCLFESTYGSSDLRSNKLNTFYYTFKDKNDRDLFNSNFQELADLCLSL